MPDPAEDRAAEADARRPAPPANASALGAAHLGGRRCCFLLAPLPWGRGTLKAVSLPVLPAPQSSHSTRASVLDGVLQHRAQSFPPCSANTNQKSKHRGCLGSSLLFRVACAQEPRGLSDWVRLRGTVLALLSGGLSAGALWPLRPSGGCNIWAWRTPVAWEWRELWPRAASSPGLLQAYQSRVRSVLQEVAARESQHQRQLLR